VLQVNLSHLCGWQFKRSHYGDRDIQQVIICVKKHSLKYNEQIKPKITFIFALTPSEILLLPPSTCPQTKMAFFKPFRPMFNDIWRVTEVVISLYFTHPELRPGANTLYRRPLRHLFDRAPLFRPLSGVG
jgi:hypothetical protein